MKIIELIGINDLLTGMVERMRQTHPQAADNAGRRAAYYAGKLAAARAAQRHLDKLERRCVGCGGKFLADGPRFNHSIGSFCARGCMEMHFADWTKK